MEHYMNGGIEGFFWEKDILSFSLKCNSQAKSRSGRDNEIYIVEKILLYLK